MKARMLAVLLVAGAAAAPVHSAEAGRLTDALRNKAGQVVFLGKVVKGKIQNTLPRIGKKLFDLSP